MFIPLRDFKASTHIFLSNVFTIMMALNQLLTFTLIKNLVMDYLIIFKIKSKIREAIRLERGFYIVFGGRVTSSVRGSLRVAAVCY